MISSRALRWTCGAVLLGLPLVAACTSSATASSSGTPPASSPTGSVAGAMVIRADIHDAQGNVVGVVVLSEGADMFPALAAGPTTSPSPSGSASMSPSASASGSSSASASTTPTPTPRPGVAMTIQIQKLSAGTHAMHLRSVGRCDLPEFASAGSILNPAHKAHGAKNPNGQEAGDLPNLTVQRDGTILAQFQLPAITLQQGQPNSVFQSSGTALVIDQRPDDDMSQPSGNAGLGIACAVIVSGQAAASSSPTPTMSPMHPSASPTMMMSPTPTPTM